MSGLWNKFFGKEEQVVAPSVQTQPQPAPVVAEPEVSTEELIRISEKTVKEEQKNLENILKQFEEAVHSQKDRLRLLNKQKEDLNIEKDHLNSELPGLLAANSKKGYERRLNRISEIEILIETVNNQIITIQGVIKEISTNREISENACNTKIQNIKIQIDELKMEYEVSKAQKMTNSALGGYNNSDSRLDSLEERLAKQKQKIAVERRLRSHNIS